MELIIIIGVIWALIAFFSKSGGSNSSSHRSSSQSGSQPRHDSSKRDTQTYRPNTNRAGSSGISFSKQSPNAPSGGGIDDSRLEGLHDAFTGAPLNKSLGLYQCQSCKVYYHTESYQLLQEANNSQCVSCRSTNIVTMTAGSKTAAGKDYTPNVVTLNNYMQYVGSVVTFDGQVHKVNESKRGNDFAVMFENKSWNKGFKLVFFRGAVAKVGGKKYITSLHGKSVRVRGLVVKNPKFGYEIIVSEKSMILSVK